MEQTHASHPHYASFVSRLIALIIDGIIIGVISFLLFFLITGIGPKMAALLASGPRSILPGLLTVIAFIIFLLWSALFEGSKLQATPGKLLCGIKVTNLTGTRITWGRAFGRALAKAIGNNNPIIPYILFFFSEKKQVAHDIIAKTVVVKK